MLSINVPIDDYIEKTFKINEEDMVILPRRKNKEIKNVSLDISLSDPNGIKNIDNEIISALSDGYINGYIESHKDITKTLLRLNYSYNEIKNITGLSQDSISKIEHEI